MIGALLLLAQVTSADPVVVQRSRPDPEVISFRAAVLPESVTVGQQATYQVAVFVPDAVRQRLRRNPEFVPPELRAMLAYDLPRGGYQLLKQRTIGRTTYEIHVFQRALFPITAGRHVIPPAELSYALPLGASFFSREEQHTVRSEPVTLVAVDPPTAGRPAAWSGAVGRFALATRVDQRRAQARDLVTVTVRVSGAGNLNLLPRPVLDLAWGSVTAAGERVAIDTTRAEIAGSKEFDFLVTPRDSGTVVIPPVRYVSWDVATRQWVEASSAPETLSVAPSAAPRGPGTIVGRTLPAIRTTWRGERGPWQLRAPAFLGAVALVPLPALLALAAAAWTRRRARRAQRPVAASLSKATASPAELRQAFRRALEARLGLDPLAFARGGDAARLLRRQGVTPGTAQAVAEALDALDAAAFAVGPASVDAAGDVPDLKALYARVDDEALGASRAAPVELGLPRRRQSRLGTPRHSARMSAPRTFALLLAAGAAVAWAQVTPPAAADAFRRGVSAWERQEVTEAEREFREAARLAPRAVDAWANLGEAAWAARDTTTASEAWQRALRLAPTTRALRERLGLLGVGTDGWIAVVPPVDPDPLAWALLGAWALGWGLLAWPRARGHRAGRGVALVALAASAVAAVGAVDTVQRAQARGLAVVQGGDPLRALPALAAEASGTIAAGEVVRIEERGEVWTRVTMDLGRRGWLATERLRPLDGE